MYKLAAVGISACISFSISAGQVCDSSLTNWSMRWGTGATKVKDEPATTACRPNHYSRVLSPEFIVSSQEGDLYVAGIEYRSKIRGDKLNADSSFKIPAESFESFDHVGVFPSMDTKSMNRAGAAVYKDKIFVEIVDADCFGDQNLFAQVPNSEALVPDVWYRVFSQVKRIDGNIEVKVILANIDSGETLASTQYVSSCNMSWIGGKQSTFMLGMMAINNPEALIQFDDFRGASR